ncbi:MAG: sugar phosphate nucleotidyltransferase [Candidatus Nanopelagicales bacterium]
MREAILLVGGRGTRLRPLTLGTPKPMLPVAGTPVTVHQIERARDAGVERVILGTSYRADVFAEQLGDGSALGVEIAYAVEDEPLGTGGAIRHAAAHLRSGPDDPVMVLNGDVLSGVDYAALVDAHLLADASVTLHLVRVADPTAYGLVPTESDGRVIAFREKPTTPAEIVTDQINAGCYVFRRSVIDAIPTGRPVSVERETFPDLLAQGAILQGVIDDAYWLDLGTPWDFVRGSADLVLGIAPWPGHVPAEALVLEGAEIAGDAALSGGTTVGRGARIGAGARVHGSVLLDGAVIAPGAVIVDSVVGRHAYVGDGSSLTECVIGDAARLGRGIELTSGARVWPEVDLVDGAVRFSTDA